MFGERREDEKEKFGRKSKESRRKQGRGYDDRKIG